ncbi:MAG: tRNA lysidine(34) synthetase TilS [Acidimicrobiia bacterium]
MVETRRLTDLGRRLAPLLDLPDGDLVMALSGGADSAALAWLLSSFDRPLRAVHVNHGLPDSPALESAARAVAARLGVDLHVVTVEIPAGASMEGQARNARYAALVDQVEPGEWILTAHTLDDQAETVVMNLLRGSGPTGLAGIPRRSGAVARPMLAVSRSDTRELAGLADLPYLDDPANLDPTHRRNVIRLEVLPALSARFNPRLTESLARTATLIASDNAHLDDEAGAIQVLTRDSSVAVPVGALRSTPDVVANRVLRRCVAQVRPPHSGTAAEIEQIREVAAGTRKTAVLSGGVQVGVEGPLLVIRAESRDRPPAGMVDLDIGTYSIGSFEVTVERIDRVCRVAPVGLWSAIFDPDARLKAGLDESGRLAVEADTALAWVPGERRLDVAWYRPGSCGYLSVFAREESGWTSSL